MMLYLNKLYDTPTLKKGIGERSCFTIGSTSVFPSSFFTLMPLRFFLRIFSTSLPLRLKL